MKESRDKNIRLRELLRVANATTVETLKKLQDAEQRHKEGLEEQKSVTDKHTLTQTDGQREKFKTLPLFQWHDDNANLCLKVY